MPAFTKSTFITSTLLLIVSTCTLAIGRECTSQDPTALGKASRGIRSSHLHPTPLPAPRGEVAAKQTEGCLLLLLGSHQSRLENTRHPSDPTPSSHLPAGRREGQVRELAIGLEPEQTLFTQINLNEPEPEPVVEPAPVMEMHATKDIKYIRRPWTRKKLTSLDVYQPIRQDGEEDTTTLRPILIFIHGGAWSFGDKKRLEHKAEMALRNNWVYVSVNYRLSPRVKHPEHSRDATAAIAYIRDHAQDFAGDPNNIVIMGHSAGAHIAAIVASDEELLGEYNMKPSDLNGVVLLDGAGYDITNQMNSPDLKGIVRKTYEQAFGDDPKLWIQASPTLQAKPGDDLPALLAVHIDRTRSRIETPKLVEAWKKAGAIAQLHYAPNPDHAGINTLVGVENDPDSKVIESFIRKAFAKD